MSRLLLGLVVGAGAALLFAPRSGSELRQDITSRTRGLAEDLVERGKEMLNRVPVHASSRSNGSVSHVGQM